MTTPNIEQAKQALRDGVAEQAYCSEHADDLLAKYRDQFVAVKGGEVVAAANDVAGLVRALREKRIEVRDTWVRYLTDDYSKYLL